MLRRKEQMAQKCTSAVVIDILQEKVGVPADTPGIETATWEELGVESLGLAETFASLELSMGFQVPHEEALQTHNVLELVLLINTCN
jgi:acyl carrier protein